MNLIRLVRWRSLCSDAKGTVLELAGGWVRVCRFIPEVCPLFGVSGSVLGRGFVINRRRGWTWVDLGNPRGVRLTLSLGWFALTIGRPREDRYRTVQILQ